MMKSLTVGLGILTVLAVTAAMTPTGLAMLGVRPSQATPAVSVIADPPPPPAPVKAPVARVAAPIAHHAAAPRSVGDRVVRTAPRPAAAAPASPGLGQAGIGQGLGQIANIANILLNLPQVLSQSHGGASVSSPASGGGGDPSWAPRRDWHQDGPDNAPGDNRH
ncbi:MAG TPA: hypothetical protein VKZ50_10490 [bacterium]|nr:hypothetical protein [bacterium]